MNEPEQLEFDLWAEERVIVLQRVRDNVVSAMARKALKYNAAETFVFHDPATSDAVIRYKI